MRVEWSIGISISILSCCFGHFYIFIQFSLNFNELCITYALRNLTNINKHNVTLYENKKGLCMIQLPCRPTISATCSELGTGTYSVIFCDFFDRSSKFGNIVVNALNPILFDNTLFIPFIPPTSEGLSDDDGDLLLHTHFNPITHMSKVRNKNKKAKWKTKTKCDNFTR